MPRQSAGNRAIGAIAPPGPRFAPPGYLTDAQRVVWTEVVNGTLPQHWKAEDAPILAAFCAAVVQQRQAALGLETGDIALRTHWNDQHTQAVASMRTLMVGLRLGPMARQPTARRRNGNARSGPVSAYDALGVSNDDGILAALAVTASESPQASHRAFRGRRDE